MLHGGEIYDTQAVQYDFSVNINPLGLPDTVRGALVGALDSLTQYPDQECRALRQALAQYTGVPADRILCGNGASELIEAAVRALHPGNILLTAPSFSGYRHAAEGAGVEIRYHMLRREEDFALTDRYLEDLTPDTDMAILCSPANPVGNLIEPDLLTRIVETCEEREIWLMVDECFLGFVSDEEARTTRRFLVEPEGRFSGPLENQEENPEGQFSGSSRRMPENRFLPARHLLVLDAFTKRFAMPGIRLGYLMAADPAILLRIHAQQPEWSVSLPAQAAGCAALAAEGIKAYEMEAKGSDAISTDAISTDAKSSEGTYLEAARHMIASERRKMVKALAEMGCRVFPGNANFIFFSSEKELYRRLLARGFLIRNCDNYPGLGRGDYRIAVLRPEQNDALLQAMREILD
ncbi:MAG: aminotransferase class I/II-fold pyridoxal phosphate-dependent enzyme [Lachnospiraceae bacterium]|nr:aminotransferase class I/II-fold pyridoxal phosphate-dependent enzyme [Lachnospiraceae bacterium]